MGNSITFSRVSGNSKWLQKYKSTLRDVLVDQVHIKSTNSVSEIIFFISVIKIRPLNNDKVACPVTLVQECGYMRE